MQEFELSLKVLEDILDKDIYFNDALKKRFQAEVAIRPLRATVAGLVGCELRHHLLFVYLIGELGIEGMSEEQKRSVALALANIAFFKRIPEDKIKEILLEKLGQEMLEKVSPLLDKANRPNEFIPEDMPKTSNRYLSLRYNTPEWVLKIWQHYGYGLTYRILKANNRQNINSVRVRTSMVSVEEVLNSNSDFAKSPVDDVLLYGGKTPLRKVDMFAKGMLFTEKMANKALLSEYKVEEPKEAFIYNGNAESTLFKEMLELYGERIGLNFGCPDTAKHLDIMKMIKASGQKNVNFFGAAPDSMESAISRPQDLVIAAPDSTNFDYINQWPDYLLHFKKEGMDALFAQEKAVLEGASHFVAEKGTLIYMVNTISKKEGHATVQEFLANHPEFTLVKEEQHYPYEEMATALFYAVMVKNTKEAKDTDSITEMPAVANEEIEIQINFDEN